MKTFFKHLQKLAKLIQWLPVQPLPIQRQQGYTLLLAIILFMLASLACTTNDTLFIRLTATPVPSVVPTAITSETKFIKGAKVYVVGTQRLIELGSVPGQRGISSQGNLSSCFRDTLVGILDVSFNVDPKIEDKTVYYKIDCGSNGQGWIPEHYLTVFNPKNGSAVVKSTDGKPIKMAKLSNPKAMNEATDSCPDATKVTVTAVTRNIDLAAKIEDTTIYVRVRCNGKQGFVLETQLALP